MKKLILFATLCLSMSIVNAQNTDELLNKLVEKNVLTASEAEGLKKSPATTEKTAIPQKIEKIRDIFTSPYLQIGGNGQIGYTYSDVSKIHHDLKAKNLFLIINGRLNNSFRYGFILEMVNPSVQEFWGEWTAAKEFNLKAGQFKSPFTLESQYVPATLETTAYSRTITNLVGYAGTDDVMRLQNGKNNFGRDAGIMASGELLPQSGHNLIQYSVGLFQGTGVTTSEVNNTKDFAGMLLLQPVKGLRAGGGVYFGQATYLKTGSEAASDHVRNRWYLSADYKSERFNARAEWINANDGGVKKEGLYGLGLYYLIPKKLNVLGKVDYYNRNKDVNVEVIDYTLGLNYYIYGQCRVQLNYTYSDYSAKWGSENSNAIAAQLQIAF